MLSHVATPSPSAQNLSPLIRSRNLIAIVTDLFASDVPLEKINLPLGELLQNLENHLMQNLGDDFYEESVFENPWLTRASEALRHQQMEVQSSLDQLRRSSQLGDQLKVPTKYFRENFEHFIEIFHDHEIAIQMFMQCGNDTH